MPVSHRLAVCNSGGLPLNFELGIIQNEHQQGLFQIITAWIICLL